MTWFIENWEFLFGGIGSAVIVMLLTWLARRLYAKRASEKSQWAHAEGQENQIAQTMKAE